MEWLTGKVSFTNAVTVCLWILLKSDEHIRGQQLSLRHNGKPLVRKHAHNPPVQWRKWGILVFHSGTPCGIQRALRHEFTEKQLFQKHQVTKNPKQWWMQKGEGCAELPTHKTPDRWSHGWSGHIWRGPCPWYLNNHHPAHQSHLCICSWHLHSQVHPAWQTNK